MIYLLPHSISQSAARFPNRTAFKCGTTILSYREMEAKMNQLAGLLHQIGISKGDRIGIYLNRNLETAIAIYGIMQAGAVYVPLDPQAPIERTKFLIKDCNINILISNATQRRKVKKINEGEINLAAIIGIAENDRTATYPWEKLDEFPITFERPFRVMDRDVAYIIYTSGSTGQPKGIMHTHSSGLAFARLTADLYQLKETDVFGNHAPIFFDISTLGYLTAPFVGGCTIIATDAHTVLPTSLCQLIEKEKITIWYSVPLAMIQMLQSGGLVDKDWSALRWVLYGGAPFSPKYLRELMTLWNQATVSNVYGPAEVNQCTFYNIKTTPVGETPIPLGSVWNNSESVVLNEEEEEIAEGTGQLCVRSATMMKGYWQQADLTERSMYRRKNTHGTYDLFYRTGDLVRVETSGLLHFIGRQDHQVKIRGYRVELEAIEALLVTHEAVAEAAVFAVREIEDALQIEAAVILQPTSNTTAAELIAFLKTKLPAYAVPSTITIVSAFPRTGSGKVKRSSLKEQIVSNR